MKMAALMTAVMMTINVTAKTHDIGGKVTDTQGTPIPYVNVVLLSIPDSTFIQGAVTNVRYLALDIIRATSLLPMSRSLY